MKKIDETDDEAMVLGRHRTNGNNVSDWYQALANWQKHKDNGECNGGSNNSNSVQLLALLLQCCICQ